MVTTRRTNRVRMQAIALALLASAAWWPTAASAEDAPPPPLAPALERLIPTLQEERQTWTPFFRDADLTLHLRTYYFNRTNPNDSVNEALAFGGWIGVKSGWLFDTFAMGATLYGSAPLYAPDDRDGTLLLQPGQKGYYVPGEAWGALRYKDYALLTGFAFDQAINPQDNRMTPNTFEGVTLGGGSGPVPRRPPRRRATPAIIRMSSRPARQTRTTVPAWPASP